MKTSVPEPAPSGEGTPVTEALLAELQNDWGRTPETLEILASIRARSDFGKEKYGTVLRAHNGRDAVNDLEQELLDALQYLKQVRLENKKLPRRLLIELRMLCEYMEKA